MLFVCIVAKFLKKFKDSKIVSSIFYGIRPAVTALIASAGITIFITALFQDGKTAIKMVKWECIALFVVIFYVSNKKSWHPIACIVLSAVVGIVFQL